MPLHLRVRPGDVAERVLVVGDPERANQISNLLEEPRVVNTNRGFLTYTGRFYGVPITVATHGVGAPSLAIVLEELIEMGARVIIRLGTAGALSGDLELGDVVIPTGAAYNLGGLFSQYLGGSIAYPAVPNHEILLNLINLFSKSGRRFHVGPIYSSDAFYAEDDLPELMGKRGILAVEMECAALFLLGLIRGVKTGAVLLVSNDLRKGRKSTYLAASDLRDVVNEVAPVVMEALVHA